MKKMNFFRFLVIYYKLYFKLHPRYHFSFHFSSFLYLALIIFSVHILFFFLLFLQHSVYECLGPVCGWHSFNFIFDSFIFSVTLTVLFTQCTTLVASLLFFGFCCTHYSFSLTLLFRLSPTFFLLSEYTRRILNSSSCTLFYIKDTWKKNIIFLYRNSYYFLSIMY